MAGHADLTDLNAFTTGNPFFTNLLELSVGRGFGALKGLMPSLLETFFLQVHLNLV